MPNILQAIKKIIDNPIIEIKQFYQSKNRANSVGEALEKYIKDIFADSFDIQNESERSIKYSQTFSYLGNQNNPPDMILKNGDAIEIKKIESHSSALALNSSYPKAKLFADSSMITSACKNCEDESWVEKDIIYIIGNIDNSNIKYLWFIYGDCFCADKEVYERIKNTISQGVNSIENIEFTQTKELGKIKKVDPLGITDLRIRGMWHIENPSKIFNYLDLSDKKNSIFELFFIVREDKFNSFPQIDKISLLELNIENYNISSIKIKNPDNPAQLIDAKLITFKIFA